MQFFKLAALLAFPILAAATPGGSPTTKPPVTTTVTVTATPSATTVSQCNTGDIQCCQSTESASSDAGTALLALLGITLNDLNVLLGVTCSPISVVGVGGDSCTASPVCCENNNFNGLVAIGCVPITL